MRTLTLHTADELLTRWREKSARLSAEADTSPGQAAHTIRQVAQAYRVCAAELAAIVAVSMELEAAHHGDPDNDVAEGNVWPRS